LPLVHHKSAICIFASLLVLCSWSCKKNEKSERFGYPYQVKIVGDFVYAATGDNGLTISDLVTEKVVAHIVPQGPAQSIDDISITSNLLFALDAQGSGFLMVYSITDPSNPILVSSAISVPVGPYCAVSAANGCVVISGGTKYFSSYNYSSEGEIQSHSASFDRNRGHPDVLLTKNGKFAIVSTHFQGDQFGLVSLTADPSSVIKLVSEIEIEGAGFTGGATTPSGFPIKSALVGNSLCVAHGKGVSFLNVNESGALELVRNLDLPSESIDIAVHGDTAFVISSVPFPLMTKIAISNLLDPKIVDTVSLDLAVQITSIDVNEKFICIAGNDKGLLIMNR